MDNLIILALLASGVWYWWHGLRARDAMLKACRQLCEQMHLQLLDQTAAVSRLGLGRDDNGRLLLRRHYVFEFSIDGADRHRGWASQLGTRVEYVRLDHPGGPIVSAGAVATVHTIH
jgi:hypothetical protein